MVFPTLQFALFFAVVLPVSWALMPWPRLWKPFLVAASYLFYAAADVLVLASTREGWANVLLESMACGTPVVASNIPGNPEVVQRPEAGLVVKRNTPDDFAAAIGSTGFRESAAGLAGYRPHPGLYRTVRG